jgi:hypothetical protein
MSDERLSLAELKERGKTLGYTKILRRLEMPPIVPLATWPGFSTVSGIPFRHVEVCYVLAETSDGLQSRKRDSVLHVVLTGRRGLTGARTNANEED